MRGRKPFFCVVVRVSDTNVDEVLSLSDPSLLPSSFLTEIQEDEVYSTIWEELQKRFALHLQTNPPEEELKIFSPHLFALQDDQNNDAEDDQSSLADEILSTVSSEAHELPGQEVDYDTDIEPGRALSSFVLLYLIFSR